MAYNTRSTFPEQIDSFKEVYELPPNEVKNVERLHYLMKKENKSDTELKELNNLRVSLKDYFIDSETWNKFCNCLVNMEMFIRDNVVGFIEKKQLEMNGFIENKKADIVDFVNSKENEINNKKDYFIKLVNQKEIEIAEMDTRTRRYWQKWSAVSSGQIEYDIFVNGFNPNLPQEAILNIDPENIDLSINGVLQIPYEDYEIKNDGQYRRIVIKGNAKDLITIGTEVIIKYYKNVGKLYFKHASTHQEGGYDQISITEGLLDNNLKNKLFNNVIESNTKPLSKKGLTWLKVL